MTARAPRRRRQASWSAAARRAAAAPPPGDGWLNIDQIARKLDRHPDRARCVVRRLIAQKQVERRTGRRVSPGGVVVRCFYYRLKG